MRDVDASSIVYGWDNYPITQFPALWDWVAEQITEQQLSISRIAYDEVVIVSPECADWLRQNNILRKDVTNEVITTAMEIKDQLGIQNDNFHPNGVSENDIFIIATAKASGVQLISDENKQTTLPPTLPRYKIPAVCALQSVAVPCINFVEYIKQSNRRFG